MSGVRVPQQAPLGNKTNTQNGVRFVLSPVEGLEPLLHDCAAALCASTLLPNWTLDETNKFAIYATSRGSDCKNEKKEISVLNFLYVERPETKHDKKERKSVLFFCRVLRNFDPCRTIVRRHVVPLFHCFIAIFSMLADFMDLICKIG